MSEQYFELKRKLEELGYNNTLPIEAVPLVECILADLLQTTRSLQHYMDLSKEALQQRDSLLLEVEPYKCDNAKLIQENNQLYRDIMEVKEGNLRLTKDSKRKLKNLSEELVKKDSTISKLQHDLRDLSLRGLCAGTLSSRNKSKRKGAGDEQPSKLCVCQDNITPTQESELLELTTKVQTLEENNAILSDEISILQNQIEHRDSEIIRLNMLLDGGRLLTAIKKDCCKKSSASKEVSLQLQEYQNTIALLKKENNSGLGKQHEAMVRALELADKNKKLQDELNKVDALALKVEEDCNKRIAAMIDDLNFLQKRVEETTKKNSELQRQLSNQNSKISSPNISKIQELLAATENEKEALKVEVRDLIELNKGLQENISVHVNKIYETNKAFCPTKEELQTLLEVERKKYEKHIVNVQDKLTETISLFNDHLAKCKNKDLNVKFQTTDESPYVRELHNKLCNCEQQVLMLTKENNELKNKVLNDENCNRQNYKDVIAQLNKENAELSKENISLSQQLSQYRSLNSCRSTSNDRFNRKLAKESEDKIDELTREIELLKKDKHEYNLRYKEALDLSEKLKRDLSRKQKEIGQLEEENCSYKMTNRTGKASADHLRDECNFLREQIKRMQSDVIKEKTLASQIKNIQIETERSSNEIQNEVFGLQKKLNLSNDTIFQLEKKCKELQSEILSLRNDKSGLIDKIRGVDQERDKLVIELDNKTENLSVLEQKVKSQSYEIIKLENEIADLNRNMNVNKVSEHKLVDSEAQINYLNGEVQRLKQQNEIAIMENKHLQNSLADANCALKLTKIEYEKSKKDVDGLKDQLQHYVAEIRRIEEMLSHKEAERSDMLEQFASLSVEANILENTNHSLESESASKSHQLQNYITKINSLEAKLIEKENFIESQSSKIAALTCKVASLQDEIKLITEEKNILEQNVTCLKQMCSSLQEEKVNTVDTDSELKLYENKIKSLSNTRATLQLEKEGMKDKLATTEKLLSNARREIVELKLALQDATSETQLLRDRVNRLSKRDAEIHESGLTKEELQLPLMLEEINEVSHEEDGDSSRYHEIHKRYSKYTHSSTL